MINLFIFIGFLFLCVQSQCVTCENQESCCSGSKCCGKGDMCCDGFSESCCPDPINGSICCLAETTFCCPRVSFLSFVLRQSYLLFSFRVPLHIVVQIG
jgi:hypothetical protein